MTLEVSMTDSNNCQSSTQIPQSETRVDQTAAQVDRTAAPCEEPRTLSSNQIQEILPHRFPFQLVDKILDYKPGISAHGIKCISVNEQFFCGHFPQEHVMPGVLIVEALAQVGAIALLSLPENQGKLAYFGGIKKCRFKNKVTPGDVLDMKCEIIEMRGPLGIGKAVARVNGKVVCQAELTFAVG